MRRSTEQKLDKSSYKNSTSSLAGGSFVTSGVNKDNTSHILPNFEVSYSMNELNFRNIIPNANDLEQEKGRLSLISSDIHHNNNMSNATQEFLQEVNEAKETCEMGSQTKDNISKSDILCKKTKYTFFTPVRKILTMLIFFKNIKTVII